MDLLEQEAQFKTFYKLNKQEQDTFLMNTTEKFEVKDARKATKTKNTSCSWQFYVTQNGEKKRVCKNFLQKLFQINDERMKTVLRFCKQG